MMPSAATVHRASIGTHGSSSAGNAASSTETLPTTPDAPRNVIGQLARADDEKAISMPSNAR